VYVYNAMCLVENFVLVMRFVFTLFCLYNKFMF